MKKMLMFFCVILIVIGSTGTVWAAITTVSESAGYSTLPSPKLMTVGQTFSFAQNTNLNSIALTINNSPDFTFYLCEWNNGTSSAGDILFDSGPMTSGSLYYDLKIDFDNEQLSAGTDYIFFISGNIGVTPVAKNNLYKDGIFAELDGSLSPGSEWDTYLGESPIFGYDMAFTMDYDCASVPVPGAIWLLGFGITAMAGLRKKTGNKN